MPVGAVIFERARPPLGKGTLVGALAKVLPTLANTTNTTPWHCISCCSISSANTTGSRVLAVLAR
eukprot:94770-Prymnesium_polylepis.1